MKYLKNKLLIPFNIKDNYGMWYDVNSYDWNKLSIKIKSPGLFGQIGDFDRFGDVPLNKITHQIVNIQIKKGGIYGDIRILEFPTNQLEIFLKLGIEIVFRNAGSIEYNDNIQYCKFLDLWSFNAKLKTNDVYSDILYRSQKIKKMLKKINISYEN